MSPASETGTDFQWLGRVTYEDGLALQESRVEKRSAGETGDAVLYLEHEPVFTIGRTRDRSSLRSGADLPHPVRVINRGGQATYHGPGQLVGYPIIDLHAYGQDLHAYLRAIEDGLIEYLRDCGLPQTGRREGLTGVWIEDRKMASIGVGVRRWITMHGFALNVSRDLSGFDAIVPCGIENVAMTSMEIETGRPWDLRDVAKDLHPFLDRSLTRLSG